MTERQLVNNFIKQMKTLPGLYVHKLGDTFGGHKKPCDCLGCYKGRFFAIEFKQAKGKLSENQEKELSLIHKAGGISLVGVFGQTGKKRNLSLYLYSDKSLKKEIIYKKGVYANLEGVVNSLDMLL